MAPMEAAVQVRGECNMNSSQKEAMVLGISPCPNDTFAFYGLLHGMVPGGRCYRAVMADVEELNQRLLAGGLLVSKGSFGLLPQVVERYWVLSSGAALGRGCGPLVVAREGEEPQDLRGLEVAVPGLHTTACRLLEMWAPEARPVPLLFSRIPEAVASGRFQAGVIIHETRFTYRTLGLSCLVDLGEWWEGETGLPIPLGGIFAARSLPREVVAQLTAAIEASVRYAWEHPQEPMPFVRAHAQEMEPEVVEQHIALYVNGQTARLDREGRKAVEEFLRRLGVNPPAEGVFPDK